MCLGVTDTGTGLTEEGAAAAYPALAPAETDGKGQTVLLVADEPQLR